MIQFLNMFALVLECLGGAVLFTQPKLRQAARLAIAAALGWYTAMPFLAHMPFVFAWPSVACAAFCGYWLRSWWRACGKAVAR